MTDENEEDPFFQALMQLTDTNKKVNDKLVILAFHSFFSLSLIHWQ